MSEMVFNMHGWPQTRILQRQFPCLQKKHISPKWPGYCSAKRRRQLDYGTQSSLFGLFCDLDTEAHAAVELTRALLMQSSWQALPFSFLPAHALSAEACRARPKEKVSAQRLCKGHWFLAFRLMVASSSLWPPDRIVTPEQERARMVGVWMLEVSITSTAISL